MMTDTAAKLVISRVTLQVGRDVDVPPADIRNTRNQKKRVVDARAELVTRLKAEGVSINQIQRLFGLSRTSIYYLGRR